MTTRMQQLGAFVNVSENLTDDRLAEFAHAGGRYIVVLLSQLSRLDGPEVVYNQDNLPALLSACNHYGIALGGWFNGWGGDPRDDANTVALWARKIPGPVCLDLEDAYHYPDGDPSLLPQLVWEVRQRLRTRTVFVNTNSPNDSMIWNGGALGYRASLRRLGVALSPQWYSAPRYAGSPWMKPDATMAWVLQHGMEDNFHDPTYSNGRSVGLSQFHGALEVTGLEDAILSVSLDQLRAARVSGATPGFQLYTLDSMPDTDWPHVARARADRLFLV